MLEEGGKGEKDEGFISPHLIGPRTLQKGKGC